MEARVSIIGNKRWHENLRAKFFPTNAKKKQIEKFLYEFLDIPIYIKCDKYLTVHHQRFEKLQITKSTTWLFPSQKNFNILTFLMLKFFFVPIMVDLFLQQVRDNVFMQSLSKN